MKQTIYKTKLGKISMLRPCENTFGCYEIACLDVEHFREYERYKTFKEVKARINTLLGIKIPQKRIKNR